MKKYDELFEREARAQRLVAARKLAGFNGPRSVVRKFPDWNVNNYKAHEQGRNGFNVATARAYAARFNVSLDWLLFGSGEITDARPLSITDVPVIAWEVAGLLGTRATDDVSKECPTEAAIDLPAGDWICLRLDGSERTRFAPPGSVIFVNRRDLRLAPNAIYLVADEGKVARCVRYKPSHVAQFQLDINDLDEPALMPPVEVIGRVRRSVVQM